MRNRLGLLYAYRGNPKFLIINTDQVLSKQPIMYLINCEEPPKEQLIIGGIEGIDMFELLKKSLKDFNKLHK